MEDKVKCEACNREFDSKSALDMHNNSKHFESVKKPLKVNKKKVRNWAVFFVIIGLIVLLSVVSSKPKTLGGGGYDSFAQCLADAGLKMYGTEWCPHCQNQKKCLGNLLIS